MSTQLVINILLKNTVQRDFYSIFSDNFWPILEKLWWTLRWTVTNMEQIIPNLSIRIPDSAIRHPETSEHFKTDPFTDYRGDNDIWRNLSAMCVRGLFSIILTLLVCISPHWLVNLGGFSTDVMDCYEVIWNVYEYFPVFI